MESCNQLLSKYAENLNFQENNSEQRKYLLETRGFRQEELDKFMFGIDVNGDITFGLHKDDKGNYISYKTRCFNSDGPKYRLSNGAKGDFWNLLPVVNASEMNLPLILCEGEFDVISLDSLNLKAFTHTTGVNSIKNAKHISELVLSAGYNSLVIALDRDEPGKTQMYKLAKELSNLDTKLTVTLYSITDFKDWNELIVDQLENLGRTEIRNKILKDIKMNSLSPLNYLRQNYHEYEDEENYFPTEVLAAHNEPPVEFIVDQLIVKNGVSLITAPQKSYKSFLTAHMISACQNESLFVGKFQTSKITKVLLIDYENRLGETKDRLIKCGANVELVHVQLDKVFFDMDENIAKKIAFTLQMEEIDLVVVDTLRRVNYKTDENSSTEISQFFAKLSAFTKFSSVIVIHHETKPQKNVKQSARGSGDITGAVDSHISLKKQGENIIELKLANARYTAEIEPVLIRFLPSEDTYKFETFVAPQKPTPEDQRESIKKALLEFIQHSNGMGVGNKDISVFGSTRFKAGEHRLRKIRDELLNDGLITEKKYFKGKQTYYWHKDFSPQLSSSI